MAKKKQVGTELEVDMNGSKDVEMKKEKKKGGRLVWLLVSLIVISAVAAILFNLGNIREKYLRSTLEKIPIVKNLLPPVEEIDENELLSNEELLQKLQDLQQELNIKTQQLELFTSHSEELEKELDRLKQIEEQQLQFKEDKQNFDDLIGRQDPNAYAAFYQSINPDTAERLYQEAVTSIQISKDTKKYASTYELMDAGDAAAILEEMVKTDLDLVVLILQNIDSEQRGKVLGEMTPASAARVTKRMAPQ